MFGAITVPAQLFAVVILYFVFSQSQVSIVKILFVIPPLETLIFLGAHSAIAPFNKFTYLSASAVELIIK